MSVAARGKYDSTSRTGMEELVHTSAPSGSTAGQGRVGLGLERVRRLGERRGHGRVGVQPGAQPPRPGASGRISSAVASASQAGPGRRPAACPPGGSARATRRGGRSTTCSAPGQPGAQRLGGGRVADPQHQLRGVGGGEARVAQQHVVVGHHVAQVVGAAAQPGRRLGQHRPARPRGPGAPPASATGSATGPHTIAPGRRLGHARGQPVHLVALGRAGGAHAPWSRAPPSARPCQSSGATRLGHGGQRLAQRQVQVHRPGPALAGRPPGAAGGGAHVGVPLGGGLGVAQLHEPLGRRAVQLDLVDGLARAHVAQLGRAVGGQHDQRHARLARLHHGGHAGWPRRCPRCRSPPPGARWPWPSPAP